MEGGQLQFVMGDLATLPEPGTSEQICNKCKDNNKILNLCQQQILIVHQAFGFEELSYSKLCF
jgi:hypothetical protein